MSHQFTTIRRDVLFLRGIVHLRKRQFPYVTASLFVLCSIAFLLEIVRGWQSHAFHGIVDVFWFGQSWYTLDAQLGSLTPAMFQHGQYYRLLTYMFLHLGVLHFSLNMWALVGATKIERAFGSLRFLLMYLICGIIGGMGAWVLVALLNFPIAAGASAALYGVFVAYEMLELVHFHAFHSSLRKQLAIFALCWILPMVIGNPTAHLFGALTGATLALCFIPHLRKEVARQKARGTA